MCIVKMDAYEYDIVSVFDKEGGYSHSLLTLDLDSEADPFIYDISNELSRTNMVHADGLYYKYLRMELSRKQSGKGSTLEMLLLEDANYEEEGVLD